MGFPPESKRAQTIEDAEVDLEEDMEDLKAAVHAYNVDFQARIVSDCSHRLHFSLFMRASSWSQTMAPLASLDTSLHALLSARL